MNLLMHRAMKTPRATPGAAAVVAFFASMATAQTPVSLNTKEYQTFTAKYVQTYLDERGTTISFSGTVYRSADGSISQIDETGGPREVRGTRYEIAKPAERSWTSAMSFTGTSTTVLYLDEPQFQSLMDANFGTCAILEDKSVRRLGESQFLGVKIIDIEEPIGRASVFRKSIAPELGCFPLQNLLIEHGVVRTITQTTQLTLGEPDPAVFSVPADYTEASPLEVEARWLGLFGQDYLGPELSQRREQEYQRGRARQRQQNNR